MTPMNSPLRETAQSGVSLLEAFGCKRSKRKGWPCHVIERVR